MILQCGVTRVSNLLIYQHHVGMFDRSIVSASAMVPETGNIDTDSPVLAKPVELRKCADRHLDKQTNDTVIR